MEIKPMQWQIEAAELVDKHRVTLISAGRGAGASWLGAYLLLEESRRARLSVGLTPRWEQQMLGERVQDQISAQRLHHAGFGSAKGKTITFLDHPRADIVMTSQSNPFTAIGWSAQSDYMVLTVIDTCGNLFDPKPIIQLIDRHMRVAVLGRLTQPHWRSSYFDLWFAQAWSAAAERDDWATYQATWNPADSDFLTPHEIERLTAIDGESGTHGE